MKKLLKAALLGVLALGLAGCSGMMGDFNLSAGAATVSGPGVSGPANVKATIENYSELESLYGARFAGDSRTIIPDGYAVGDIDLYVYGEAFAAAAGYVNKFPVTKMSLTGSDFSLNIPRDDWELTAIAVKKGATIALTGTYATDVATVEREAVLMGTAQLMLLNRPASPKVSFTLSPDGLKTPGTFQNEIKFEQWSETMIKLNASNKITTGGIFDTIEVSLKNKLTGVVENYADNTTPVSYGNSDIEFTAGTAANQLNDFTFTFGDGTTKMAPGTYLLYIKLSDSGNSMKTITISDDFVVLPGYKNDKAFTIQNRLEQPAAAPTDFKLSYSDPEVIKKDMYTMNFEWARAAAKNEEWFEILFVDITGKTAVPAIDDVWDKTANPPAVAAAYTDKAKYWDFNVRNDPLDAADPLDPSHVPHPGDPNYIDGSLTAGNTALKMYAELGHQYVAWIRAVNVSGESDWVAATFNGTTGTAFTGDTANLYRIEYNLSGGAYGGNTYNKIEYKEYKKIDGTDAGTELWDAASDSLIFDGMNFKYWVTDPADTKNASIATEFTCNPQDPDGNPGSGDEYKIPRHYKGYSSIEVYAYYSDADIAVAGSIKIRDKKKYDIDPSTFISWTGTTASVMDLDGITAKSALTATESRIQETTVLVLGNATRGYTVNFKLPTTNAADPLVSGATWNYDAVTIELRSQLGNILAAKTWGDYGTDPVPAVDTNMTLTYSFPDNFKPQCCTVRITAVYAGQSYSYTYNVQVRQ
ncbi:MAG: hypothetical protein MJ176_10645 [Treponema sp.]|nr:hypothetical protein [Treponema sp.]